jgi:Putative adhesin
MSITEDAPAPPAARRSPLHMPGRARRASPWWWLVLVSFALLLAALAVMAVWWTASRETQVSQYRVLGAVSAIELDVGTADVEIVGGASTAVEVRRTAEFAFGRPPEQTRRLDADVLEIRSRCPDTVIGTCQAAYRIAVRDNVQVTVITTGGRVRISSLNGSARVQTGSGAVAVDGFCGFRLSAISASGDVGAAAACSPDRMELRSTSGDVRAFVPAGRYRVDASSSRGSVEVRNLTETDDAPFAVQAISGTGDVIVEGRG